MAKFSSSVVNGYKLYNGQVLSENEWNGQLEATQNGIQEHEHTINGGAGTTDGDASPIQNTYIRLTNKSTATVNAGSVVVIDTANDNAFTTTTTQDDSKVLGVLVEDTDPDGLGWIQVSGIADVKVDGSTTAIARGDLLSTYTTTGYAGKVGTATIGAILGKALQEASNDTTIKVLLTLN